VPVAALNAGIKYRQGACACVAGAGVAGVHWLAETGVLCATDLQRVAGCV
jgi:hypothetical protein